MKAVLAATAILVILAGSILALSFVPSRPAPQSFALSLYPAGLRGDAIAGQRVVLLVTVAESGSAPDARAVKLTASAPNSSVSVSPELISAGQVGEVAVIPGVEAVGGNVTVTVSGERDGLVQSRTLQFTVLPGENTDAGYAVQLRERFVAWLQASHPELGITNGTQWLGTVVSPHWLVVSHWLFFSKDWEVHLYWHVMIPPHDWARIDLRQRFTELAPSLSFEISSLNAGLTPVPIAAPETAWR